MPVCKMCGNDLPPFTPTCPFCGQQQSGSAVSKPSSGIKSVNIKSDLPTVEEALSRLSLEVSIARSRNYKALKIIHGYGSGGKGGVIKPAVKKLVTSMSATYQIKEFIEGSEFHEKSSQARRWISTYPWLKRDKDFNRKNPGMTIIFL